MNLLYTNLADATTDGTTLTSDLTADVGYPLANMQNGLRTKIWQVTNASAAQHYVHLDLGSAQTVNALALINGLNLLTGAQLKIQGSNQPLTARYGSNYGYNYGGAVASVSVDIDWADNLASGGYGYNYGSNEGFGAGGAGSLDVAGNSLYAYFTGGSYRYWMLAFTLPAPQTVSLGRLILGNALTLAAGHKQGFSDFLTPVVAQATTIGGQVYTDQRNKFRTLKLQFTGITDANKYAQMVAFAAAVGVNNNFVVTLDPSTTTTTGRTSMYGRLSAFPQFTNMFNAPSGQYHNATMDLVESV